MAPTYMNMIFKSVNWLTNEIKTVELQVKNAHLCAVCCLVCSVTGGGGCRNDLKLQRDQGLWSGQVFHIVMRPCCISLPCSLPCSTWPCNWLQTNRHSCYKHIWWWLIPRRQGLLGKLMVNSCMLISGCRDRFLMRIPLPHTYTHATNTSMLMIYTHN